MPRTSNRLHRASLWLLSGAVAIAVLGMGGVYWEVIVGAALLSLLSLMAATSDSGEFDLTPLSVFFGVALVLTLAQAVPLPFAWVEAIAPATGRTLRSAAIATGRPAPTMAALSLDPEATLLGAVWWIALGATYVCSRRVVGRITTHGRVTGMLAILGVLAFAVGVVGTLLIAGDAKLDSHLRSSGALYASTLVNPNHMAAFLNLGAITSLAHAQNADGPRIRWRWSIVSSALFLAMILTGSRAGIIGGAVGAAAVLVSRRSLGPAVMLLVTAIVGSIIIVASPVGDQLETLLDFDRLERNLASARLGVHVALEWPWSGVGRGAFGMAHTQVLDRVLPEGSALTEVTVAYAHNTAVQLLADYGLLAGSILLLSGLLLVIRAVRLGRREEMGAGIAVAFAVLGAANLVDFSLDVLGVAMPAVLLLGVLARKEKGWRVPARWVRGASIVAAVGVLATIPASSFEPGPRRDAWVSEHLDLAIERFPADPYVFLKAGDKSGDLALLEHAWQLNPADFDTALAMARATKGHPSLRWIRIALSRPRPHKRFEAGFALLVSRAGTASEVLDGLPFDPLVVTRFVKSLDKPSDRLLRALFRRHLRDEEVLVALARHFDRRRDWDRLDDVAIRLLALSDPRGYLLLGRAYQRKKMPLEAFHMLVASGSPQAALDAAQLALDAGWHDRAVHALRSTKPTSTQLGRWNELMKSARNKE